MNYYKPMKKADTLKWQFTCRNDNVIYPVGYCNERNCEHDTPEEASDCYRDYCEKENNGVMCGFPMTVEDKKRGEVLNITSSY